MTQTTLAATRQTLSSSQNALTSMFSRPRRAWENPTEDESDYQKDIVTGYRQALDVTPNGLVFGMKLSMEQRQLGVPRLGASTIEGVAGKTAPLHSGEERRRALFMYRHTQTRKSSAASQELIPSRPKSAPNTTRPTSRETVPNTTRPTSRETVRTRTMWRPTSALNLSRQPEVTPISRPASSMSRVSSVSSGNLADSQVELAQRHSMRQHRSRPWREGGDINRLRRKLQELSLHKQREKNKALRAVHTWGHRNDKSERTDPEDLQQFEYFQTNQEKKKWRLEQKNEKRLQDQNYVPPQFVLVSSAVPGADELVQCLRKDKNITAIIYEFAASSLDDIIDVLEKSLEEYKPGARAQSILFVCKCGPGYFYLLKNKVLTPQKLSRPENIDVVTFWRRLGSLMSKLSPDDCQVNFYGGGFITGNKQGQLLLRELQRLALPNTIHCEAPPDFTAEGKKMLGTYFDMDKWRAFAKSHGIAGYSYGTQIRFWR